MISRKLVVAVLAILCFWQLGAVSLDDLQDLYYSPEEETEESIGIFSREAQIFIEENDGLDELDTAMEMWQTVDQESSSLFLVAQLAGEITDPKYRYLWIKLEEDPQNKLRQARSLIQDWPEYAGGYRALLLTWVNNFYADDLFTADNEDHLALQQDLPSIALYGSAFPGEKYARLASIYYYMQRNDLEAAKPILMEALLNEEAWVDDLGLYECVPLSASVELLKYHIRVLQELDQSGYNDYLISGYANKLATYLVDEAEDYQGMIAFFGAEPFTWNDNQILYCLASAYFYTDQADMAGDLLACSNDATQAVELQNWWIYEQPDTAEEIYSASLAGSSDPLKRYLLARSLSDKFAQLDEARALIKAHSKLDYGYKVLVETYMEYYGRAALDDLDRETVDALWKKDIKYLRNYYLRFEGDEQARIGYFLIKAWQKDTDAAIDVFKVIYNDEWWFYGSGKLLSKIMIDWGAWDLLYLANECPYQVYLINGDYTEDMVKSYTVSAYCSDFYVNEYYDQLIQEVTKHQDWLEYPDVQYMLVDSYFFIGDYTNTVAATRLMVEKGTIGTTLLESVEDENLTKHPDWQALLDYAATLPDPQAAEEEEFEDEVIPEEFENLDY